MPTKKKSKNQEKNIFYIGIACIVISIAIVIACAVILYNNQRSLASSQEVVTEESQDLEKPNLKNILVIGTGGTIAGSGTSGKQTGYKSGALHAEELIEAIPKIKDVANIKVDQLFNLNSDDITQNEWLTLANRINALENDNSIDGVVITHGTDTMEETAYFLNLVLKTTKPVVITGSMRPATALSADGPLNLYQAILVAASEESMNKPVLCVMNDMILGSRSFQKTSTSAVQTMQAGDLGQIGVVRDNYVIFTEKDSPARCTTNSEFTVNGITSLPKVSVVYFHVDASVEILNNALSISDGVVIAGAGAGEFSKEWQTVIEASKKPIVISTRSSTGLIIQDSLLASNTIASSYMNPQKAAVLLRVALSNNKDRTQEDLIRIFETY